MQVHISKAVVKHSKSATVKFTWKYHVNLVPSIHDECQIPLGYSIFSPSNGNKGRLIFFMQDSWEILFSMY